MRYLADSTLRHASSVVMRPSITPVVRTRLISHPTRYAKKTTGSTLPGYPIVSNSTTYSSKNPSMGVMIKKSNPMRSCASLRLALASSAISSNCAAVGLLFSSCVRTLAAFSSWMAYSKADGECGGTTGGWALDFFAFIRAADVRARTRDACESVLAARDS